MPLMDNKEESANVQNENIKMEFTGSSLFSSSESQPPSKKRKFEYLELENENLKKSTQILRTTLSKVVEISQFQFGKKKRGVDIKNVEPVPDDAKKLLQDRIDKLESSNNGLKTQLRKINEESKRLRVEYYSLKSFKDKSSKKIEELEAQLVSKKNAEIDFRKKISEMEEQLEHQRKLFGAETNKLETMIKEKEKKIMELEAQLQAKSNIETSLQTKINEMEKKSDHQKKLHESEIGKLTSAVEEQVKKIKDLDAQILLNENNYVKDFVQIRLKLNEQRRAFEIETCELDAIIEEQKKKMEEMEIKLESKEKESKDFQAENELMQMCYKDELKKIKKQHEKEMEEMKSEMEAKINENTKIYENEIQSLKSSHEDFMKTESENHQNIIRQYQNAIKILNWKVNFSNAETDFKAKISKLERKSQIIYEKIADCEKKIQDFQNGLKVKEPECITLD